MTPAAEDIIAIDVLLEPDQRMLDRAEADNARLRDIFPGSFALDESHRPHITLLQCFVPSGELDQLCKACGAVLRAANVRDIALRATRFDYSPGPGAGVAGIWADLTPRLSRLQTDVIAAALPFTVRTAGIEAFTADHGNPAYDAALIDYVTNFVENYAGGRFDPHVSTGFAPTAELEKIRAEPFTAFDFAPASAAVYQLGPFGTAARLITRWENT